MKFFVTSSTAIFSTARHTKTHIQYYFFIWLYANKSQLMFPCDFIMPGVCSHCCVRFWHRVALCSHYSISNSFRCHMFPSTIGSWEICRAICCQCKRKIYVSFTAFREVSLRRHATNRPNDQLKRTLRILLRLRVSFRFTNHNRFPFKCNLLAKVTTTQRSKTARGSGINPKRIEWRRLDLPERKNHTFLSLFICSTVNWARTFAVHLYRCSAFTRRDQLM